MYCFVLFQKGLCSVFHESSQTAWLFCTTSNIYCYIPTNSHKTLTNYIPVFFGRITLSIGENRMKIRSVVFEFIVDRETDRQTRRRTLFYNMYRYIKIKSALVSIFTSLLLDRIFFGPREFGQHDSGLNLGQFPGKKTF